MIHSPAATKAEPAVLRRTIDQVAVLTMNRPASDNVFDAEMLAGLRSHTAAIARDDHVGAVVVTGAGRNFSLGGPLDEFENRLARGDDELRAYCRELTDALADVILGLYTLPCPVVAAVHGQAAGAGFSLALACDLRIASDRARFNFAYGALGASTDGGMSWLLPRVSSPARALALLLEQPVIRAARAHEEGLVTEVVPAADLLDRACAVATDLSLRARHSVRSAKRLVHASALATLPEHLRDEHRAFVEGLRTNDMRDALKSRRPRQR